MHGHLNVKQGTVLLYVRYLLQQAQLPFAISNLYSSENNYWARNVYSAYNRPSQHFIWYTTDLLNILFGAAKLWQNSVSTRAGNKKFSTQDE